MKTFKIEFTVLSTNEFGMVNVNRTAKEGNTAEETFLNCLNSLPKRIEKGWQAIEFDFEGQTFDVSKHHLIETNWDFNNSVDITNN